MGILILMFNASAFKFLNSIVHVSASVLLTIFIKNLKHDSKCRDTLLCSHGCQFTLKL